MNTRSLNTRKFEIIRLTQEELAAEQEAKVLIGDKHLTDEQFRDLVSRDIHLIEGPIKAPEAAV